MVACLSLCTPTDCQSVFSFLFPVAIALPLLTDPSLMICYCLNCSGGKEVPGSHIASALSTVPPPWLSKTPLSDSFGLERTRMFSKLLIGLYFHCLRLGFWIFQQKEKKLYRGIIFLLVGSLQVLWQQQPYHTKASREQQSPSVSLLANGGD